MPSRLADENKEDEEMLLGCVTEAEQFEILRGNTVPIIYEIYVKHAEKVM